MHAEHRFHGEFFEQAFLDHFTAAALAFLGRLENEIGGAVEALALGQVLGRAQQHGGVAVVAAGVHAAVVLGLVAEAVHFVDGQGVHVGAHADGARAAAAGQFADHPRLGKAAVHLNAPGFEFCGDDARRAQFLERGLGVGVDVAPDGADFGLLLEDLFGDFHGHTRKNMLAIYNGATFPPVTPCANT